MHVSVSPNCFSIVNSRLMFESNSHPVSPPLSFLCRCNSFIDASLSIRKTTHANMYQLVVTRAFQEGEEQLLEEDAESELSVAQVRRQVDS